LNSGNSIIAGNNAPGGPDISLALTSQGYNLIGDTNDITSISGDTTGNILNVLPLLGPLANNGGPTQTHALLTGSPAINAGSNALASALTTDQRGPGFLRNVGGRVDIGAFEFDGCNPDITPPAITCPGSITRFTDPGQNTATVNPGAPVATDICQLQSVSGVRSDGKAPNAPYPLGVTLITWTARDATGNVASCSQSIAVMAPSGGRRRP
jgi:hypothetical protein